MQGAVLHDAGGKMGFGILRYSPNPISCIIDSDSAGQSARELTGIPRDVPIVATVQEAFALGADAFVLGIAPAGGLIPSDWYPVIDEVVRRGLSVVNGLHDLLGPRYGELAPGQFVWDIRVEPEGLAPGTGAAAALRNRRLLLIGTDMAVGKMTAGLEIYRVAREKGIDAEFIATGQIGITVTGAGVPLDAIRVDFAGGAIEREVLRAREADLVIVEGQGSLIHPSSTANLPLLRGSCPTHLILCLKAGQSHLRNNPHIRIPPMGDFIRLYESLASACGTYPTPKTVGIAINTIGLSDDEAQIMSAQIESEIGLPVTDPVRNGPSRLLDAVMA